MLYNFINVIFLAKYSNYINLQKFTFREKSRNLAPGPKIRAGPEKCQKMAFLGGSGPPPKTPKIRDFWQKTAKIGSQVGILGPKTPIFPEKRGPPRCFEKTRRTNSAFFRVFGIFRKSGNSGVFGPPRGGQNWVRDPESVPVISVANFPGFFPTFKIAARWDVATHDNPITF